MSGPCSPTTTTMRSHLTKTVQTGPGPISNPMMDANEAARDAQVNLNRFIEMSTNIGALRKAMVLMSQSVSTRIAKGMPMTQVLAYAGLDHLTPEDAQRYCDLAMAMRNAIDNFFLCSYRLTADDQGWARRSVHTGFAIDLRLKPEMMRGKKFKCPTFYRKHKIKGVRVGPMNKDAPWNTRYRPDIPHEGITVAIGQTTDVVHVKEYSQDMTFHDLALKVIEQYPIVKGYPICPDNTLFSMAGRVFVCKMKEPFWSHWIREGTLFGMTAGAHNPDGNCCAI